jgi:hypothetical protein
MISAPSPAARSTAAANRRSASLLPKKFRSPLAGTPIRAPCGEIWPSEEGAGNGGRRENGSSGSNTAAIRRTSAASATSWAKIDTQSRVRQAGTTPRVLNRPRVGFSPTILLNAAGTRPDPAVSVPREKLTKPLATATAEPALDPPDT